MAKIIGLTLITRKAAKRLAVLFILITAFLTGAYIWMISMPGESYEGALLPLTETQIALRDSLKTDVAMLAEEIGPRGVLQSNNLAAAANYIEQTLEAAGYEVTRQCFDVDGVNCCNLEVEITGSSRPDEIIVVGGHYDSVLAELNCPGANDNASGTAATLAIARAFVNKKPQRTVRFVLFVNEEPPYFQRQKELMGSWVYAQGCKEREENIVAMFSLETIGYYSDEANSQAYPFPLGLVYPSTGNFITFVGNIGSRQLVRESISSFRKQTKFPSEGGALPGFLRGVGWSDHWSFWKAGYNAIMITDTAPFRYPHYHKLTDTPDKLDYNKMAVVVEGLTQVINDLANPDK